MNSRYRSLVVAALAASLTVLAQAQSSGSSSTGSSGSTGSTGSSTRSTGSTSGSGSTSSGTMRDSSATSGQSGTMRSSTSHSGLGSSSDLSSVQRVTKDSLKSQVTAKALIGKNVHDSSGEKIGEVQDIVLDSTSAPQLASGFANREEARESRSGSTSASTQPGTSKSRVSPSGTYAAGAGGDGASTTSATDRMRSAGRDAASAARDLGTSAMGALSSTGPAAIISAGGMLGMGESMIRVPLSQLSYDATEDRVTLNISRDQLSSLTDDESRDTSTRAAE